MRKAGPSGTLKRSSPLGQALGLTHKHLTRLERLARDKPSSLLRIFINYGRKKFYKIGSRSKKQTRQDISSDSSKQPDNNKKNPSASGKNAAAYRDGAAEGGLGEKVWKPRWIIAFRLQLCVERLRRRKDPSGKKVFFALLLAKLHFLFNLRIWVSIHNT